MAISFSLGWYIAILSVSSNEWYDRCGWSSCQDYRLIRRLTLDQSRKDIHSVHHIRLWCSYRLNIDDSRLLDEIDRPSTDHSFDCLCQPCKMWPSSCLDELNSAKLKQSVSRQRTQTNRHPSGRCSKFGQWLLSHNWRDYRDNLKRSSYFHSHDLWLQQFDNWSEQVRNNSDIRCWESRVSHSMARFRPDSRTTLWKCELVCHQGRWQSSQWSSFRGIDVHYPLRIQSLEQWLR